MDFYIRLTRKAEHYSCLPENIPTEPVYIYIYIYIYIWHEIYRNVAACLSQH